jgi:two-component system response regulator PilR (NtrC family)
MKEIPLPEKIGSLDEFMRRIEKEYIIRALEGAKFDKEKAATALDLGLSTLYRKIKDLNIEI